MKTNVRILGLALPMLPMYLPEVALQPDQEQRTRSAEPMLAGTIRPGPVRLNSTLRPDKNESGDAIIATVMQDVPLGAEETLRRGSKMTGHVVDTVVPAKGSDESKISFQFDQVRLGTLTIPSTARLRTAASKTAVIAATSQLTSSEDPDTEVEIGGDQVCYGRDGLVMVGSKVVERYTSQGDLAYAGQDLGTACRDTIDGNEHPPAFWLFSVNAGRAYGFRDMTVFRAGRNAPVGEITLSSTNQALKADKEGAMLLLVSSNGSAEAQARTTSSRACSRPIGQ
jgi:hypothetical protein